LYVTDLSKQEVKDALGENCKLPIYNCMAIVSKENLEELNVQF